MLFNTGKVIILDGLVQAREDFHLLFDALSTLVCGRSIVNIGLQVLVMQHRAFLIGLSCCQPPI